jgi:hypothetical protein
MYQKNDMVIVRGENFSLFATSGAPYLGHRIYSAETEITSGTQFFVLYNFGLGSF